MPYRASDVEKAWRIAPTPAKKRNASGGLDDIVLNVKYWPLTYNKLNEWKAAEAALTQPETPDGDGHKSKKVVETDEEKAARLEREREAERREQTVLARQLSDGVVFDLDLVEDDGVTPKAVTYDYLLTLDIGFLKDIKREIEDRAFPEKKELRQAILSNLSPSGT